MGITIPEKDGLYIETGPSGFLSHRASNAELDFFVVSLGNNLNNQSCGHGVAQNGQMLKCNLLLENFHIPWSPIDNKSALAQAMAGHLTGDMGWVGLWGFLWWAPSAKRKDHHGVSSGWSSVWHRSNTGLSSTQYEQIPIILGIWPFWLTPFFFRSITFWRAYG